MKKKKNNNKNKIKKYDFILLDECPLTKDSSISALGTLFNVLDAWAAIFEFHTPTHTEIL